MSSALAPVLPGAAHARGVLSAFDVDWMFTAFCVASFLAHLAVVLYLDAADTPYSPGAIDAELAVAATLHLDGVAPEPAPPPPRPTSNALPAAPAATMPAPSGPTATHESPRRQANPARAQANRGRADTNAERPTSGDDEVTRLREVASQRARQIILSGLGAQRSALDDLLRGGTSMREAADVYEQARAGTTVADRRPAGTLTPRTGGGSNGSGAIARGIGVIAQTGNGTATQIEGPGPAVERAIRGRVTPGEIRDGRGPGGIDEGQARRQLMSGARCVAHAYSRYLTETRDPMRYTMRVSMTVNVSGTVSGVRVEGGPSAAIESRATTCFRGLRMTPPEGGPVSFQVPLVVAPPADM